MKQKVLIFILSFILLSSALSQDSVQPVTHPDFVSTGSASPVQNVGLGATSDITTNYQEMVTDHSKKIVSIGLPANVDQNENLFLSEDLEDPVFINSKGQEVSATEAIAESEEKDAIDDEELQKIEKELEESHASTAGEAHELIMAKHAEILKFLSTIARTAKLNPQETKILADVKKYLELLKARHFLIKGQAEEDIVQDLQIKIHEITFAIDQHEYEKAGYANVVKGINKRENHEEQNRELSQAAELAENTIQKGPEYADNAIVAIDRLEYLAQRNAKFQQVKLTQDSCTALIPFKNRNGMTQHLLDFKTLLDVEAKRLQKVMDNYDFLIDGFRVAQEHLAEEETEELLEQIAVLEEHEDSPQNTRESLKEAKQAVDAEDEVVAQTKLILGQSQVQAHLDTTILSYESVVHQQALLRSALQAVADGQSYGDSADNFLEEIGDEVLKRQAVIKFIPEIEQETLDVQQSIRKGQVSFAVSKLGNIVNAAQSAGYTDITNDKSPAAKSKLDKVADFTSRDVSRIQRLEAQARGFIQSEQFGTASVRVELLADQLQKRAKLDAIESVSKKVSGEDDALVLEEILTQLKAQFSSELDNFVAEKESLGATKEAIENLEEKDEDFENFADEIDELRGDRSLTAQVRDALTSSYDHAKLDERDEARRFLVEAQTRVTEREQELEFATDSVDKQLGLLNDAIESAKDEDVKDIKNYLEEIREEVLRHQNVASFNNNVRTREDEVQQRLFDEDVDAATEALEGLVAEVIGRQPESAFDRHAREVGEETADLATPVDQPSEDESDTDFVVREIQNDAEAAIETIQSLEEGEAAKEAAELEVELLEAKIQRAEKLDDVKTTKAKLLQAQESEDKDAQIEALADFENSIHEEQVALELLQEKFKEVKKQVFDSQDVIENGSQSNTQLKLLLTGLKDLDGADSGVKEFLQQAIDSLDLNKKEKAVLDVQSAKDHIDRILNEFDITLEAIDSQLGNLKDSIKAVNEKDEDALSRYLEFIEDSIAQQQILFLTDKDSRSLRNEAIREIVEGRLEQAIQNVQKLADNAVSSLKEQVQQVFEDGEVQAAADEAVTSTAEEAKELVEEHPDDVEAAQKAVEESGAAAQEAEKINEIEDTKAEVEENEDAEAVEELLETVKEEEEAIEEELSDLEETKEQLEELLEDFKESTAEEIEEELEEIEEEENEALNADVQNALDEAVESAESGDLATAEESIETAIEEIEEQERELEHSQEIVERQEEKLEEAQELVEDGDIEEALEILDSVQEDTKEQEQIRVDEDIQEHVQEGLDAIAEGDQEAAAEAVDEIAENAEEREEEAEEEEREEEEAEAAAEAEEQAIEIPTLEIPSVEVYALLNALEDALNDGDWLRSESLLKQFDAEDDEETAALAQDLANAIEEEDGDAAFELLDQIRSNILAAEAEQRKLARKAKQNKKSNLRGNKQRVLRA